MDAVIPAPAESSATAEQIYHIFIKATPEAIWDAIVEPEFSARYFYGSHVETTAEPGTPFRYHAPDGSGLWGDETVLEADPPRRLAVTWRSLFDPGAKHEPASRVTWIIDPQDDHMTLLTVIHDRLENSPNTAVGVSGAGWMLVLSGLKTLLETGAGLIEVEVD